MDFEETEKYVVWVKEADDVSELTLRDYGYHIRTFGKFAKGLGVENVEDVTADIIRKYIMEGEERGNKPRTINGKIRYLKASFNVLVADGIIEQNPVDGIKKRKEPLDTVRPLSDEDVKKLLEAADRRSFIGRRNYVCMLLMLDTGIRPSEMFQLNVDDWHETHIIVRDTIAKGRKQRILPLYKGVIRELRRYEVLRKGWGGRILFPSQDGGRLKTRSFGDALNKYADVGGLKDFGGPYTLRHTFAVNFLRGGGDVFTLQKMLGHETLEMTRIYVQLSKQDIQELAGNVSASKKFIKSERKRRRL